jgi:hypothetical protein
MEYTSGLSAEDDNGDSGHDRETDGELGGAEERKVKAAAKSNRKVSYTFVMTVNPNLPEILYVT